jgi:hypothetical protein
MAFASTALYMLREGSLTNGRGAEWRYDTSDSTGTVFGTGYFAGVMRGSRGLSGRGVSTGDICHIVHGSTAFTLGVFTGSTADQASTSASTGWKTAYNGTLTALTAL